MAKRASTDEWEQGEYGRGAKRARVVFEGGAGGAGGLNDIVIQFTSMGFGNVVKEAVRTLCYEQLYTKGSAQRYVASGARASSRIADALATLDEFYPGIDWEIHGCNVLAGLEHAERWYSS